MRLALLLCVFVYLYCIPFQLIHSLSLVLVINWPYDNVYGAICFHMVELKVMEDDTYDSSMFQYSARRTRAMQQSV